jgi:hypothetical protein
MWSLLFLRTFDLMPNRQGINHRETVRIFDPLQIIRNKEMNQDE